MHPTRPCLALALAALLSPAAGVQNDRSACAAVVTATSIQQINAERERGARCGTLGAFSSAAPLAWSPLLEGLARQQAAWLADYGMLLHTGPELQTLTQRAQAVGYSFARIAENLAQGQTTVPELLAAWKASDSHCANLYDPLVTEMALACAPGAGRRRPPDVGADTGAAAVTAGTALRAMTPPPRQTSPS